MSVRRFLRNSTKIPQSLSSAVELKASWGSPKILCSVESGISSLNQVRWASSMGDSQVSKWLMYNKVVFPPTEPGEPERPAEVYHEKKNIRYDPDKMWYLATMVRGMSVEEAKKQLTFKNRLGAKILIDIIEETETEAVNKHNVEFKTNLWIAECFVRNAPVIKGMKLHARGRRGLVHYRYIHVYLKLREGKPPRHYYPPAPTTKELVEEYIKGLRNRRIIGSL